ncbi:MAG: hypothetical protein ACOX62_06455 [Christensenellales bacterium]|jgi:hypothetical protein
MKPMKLRLVAILTAMVMMLGILPVLAEEPATPQPPTMEELMLALFESGKSIQTDFAIKVSPKLGEVIYFLTKQMPSEEDAAILATLVNAVNKLKTTIINNTNISGVVGTDQGDLFNFQAAINEQTLENNITSNLLPGLALSVDPAMMSKMSTAGQTPDQAFAPYINAFMEYINTIEAAKEKEEGTYEIPGVGTFNSRSQREVTMHMAVNFLEKLMEIYNNDSAMKKLVEEAASANQDLNPTDESTTPEDMAQELTDTLELIKSQEDQVVLSAITYEDGSGKSYTEMTTPEGEMKNYRIELLINVPNAQNGQYSSVEISAKILTKTNLPTFEDMFDIEDEADQPAAEDETSQPATEEEVVTAIDWQAQENDIKSGFNFIDSLINLSFSLKREAPQVNSNFGMNWLTGGITIGISYNDSSNMGAMTSEGSLSLALMSSEPLLTISYTASPVDAQPIAPVTEGAQQVIISEDQTPEEADAMMEQLMSVLMPALQERLIAALPEEGPTILTLIEDAQGQAEEEMLEPEAESVEEQPEAESEVEPEAEPVIDPEAEPQPETEQAPVTP